MEGIDPILPNFDIMFSGKYWSHIQVFKNLLNGSSEFIGTRLIHMFNNFDVQQFEIPQTYFPKMSVGCFLDYVECIGVSKVKK